MARSLKKGPFIDSHLREKVEGMNARTGALADDKINAEIFHGGIEDLFDGGLQAMDFVEEEDFVGFERSEDGR